MTALMNGAKEARRRGRLVERFGDYTTPPFALGGLFGFKGLAGAIEAVERALPLIEWTESAVADAIEWADTP